MADFRFDRDPSIVFLDELIQQLLAGDLRIPRFQREFVWDDGRMLDLLGSVREGIPFGSVLVWRTRQHRLSCYGAVGTIPLAIPADESLRPYLLDGLQRLTTFVGVLCQHPPGKPPPRAIGADKKWSILYDLENQSFQLEADVTKQRKYLCLPLEGILESRRYFVFQRQFIADLQKRGLPESEIETLVERADRLVSSFRGCKIPVISLATDELAAATKAFQRINTAGTKMSLLHMVNALTYSEHFDLLGVLEELWPRLELRGWGELDRQTVLQVCRVQNGLEVYDSDPDPLSQALQDDPGSVERAVLSLEKGCDFLREVCLVAGPSLLPFTILLVFLAAALGERPTPPSPRQQQDIHDWFWLSVYSRTPFGVSSAAPGMLGFLRDLLADSPDALWWGRETKQLAPLPPSVRLDGSRNATFVAQLCRLRPQRSNGGLLEQPHTRVAQQGAEVLQPLLDGRRANRKDWYWNKGSRGATLLNRVLADPADLDHLRALLLDAPLESIPPEIPASHGIPMEALHALRQGNTDDFFSLREEHLRRLEQQFLDEIRQRLARFLPPDPAP